MAGQVMYFLSQLTIRSRNGDRLGLRAISPSTMDSGIVWTSCGSFSAAKRSATAARCEAESATAAVGLGVGTGVPGRAGFWAPAVAANASAIRAGVIRVRLLMVLLPNPRI